MPSPTNSTSDRASASTSPPRPSSSSSCCCNDRSNPPFPLSDGLGSVDQDDVHIVSVLNLGDSSPGRTDRWQPAHQCLAAYGEAPSGGLFATAPAPTGLTGQRPSPPAIRQVSG